MIVEEHQGQHRDSAERPPRCEQTAAAAVAVRQVPAGQTANERHDLHERAKSKARRKRLASQHHHRRNPSGEAENAEQAEECRRPDREGCPAIAWREQGGDGIFFGPRFWQIVYCQLKIDQADASSI